jgi:hypothetical protein
VLITPEAAVFGEFLGTTTHPWQLTVALGFSAGGDGEGDVDLGLSLVGDALDLSVATGLLSGDVAGDSGVRIVPRFLHGDEAAAAIDAATAGRAPAAGRVPEGVAARLLSLPARTIGTWPVVEAPPAPPEAVIGAARNAVPPHVLVQGGSGQGKTTFLEHLVDAGLEDGAAIVVVCPHGDLASRAAARIARAGAPLRVIDYGANDPVPWNLTVPDPGIGLEEHASLLTDVVRGLWLEGNHDWFGPVWTRLMRALLSVLVRDPEGPHSIARLPELLTAQSPFRGAAVDRIGDRTLRRIIEDELVPMLTTRDPGNTVAWMVSKLDYLIGDPTMRAVVGSRLNAVDLEPVLRGESLVVSVPERHLTSDGARVLASMVVGRLWLLARRTPPKRPVHLFVDEWQKLPIPALGQILTEGRKRGLRLRLANQNSAQIPGDLWETATGNTGAIITFATGPKDAFRIAPMFAATSLEQITRLPRHWVAVTAGGRDAIAPAPAPLRRDGGRALAAGHAATLAEVRGRALGAAHALMAALLERRERRIGMGTEQVMDYLRGLEAEVEGEENDPFDMLPDPF